MGVNGLWTVVQPCARPTNLATLNRKRLAVDASIWIYQFLKAVRDKEGNALRNSHVVGFFRRICKLLWFGIKPVFVFDGGAPALKRTTLQGRRRRREGRREDAVRTAGKLLAVQMQRAAEQQQEEDRRKRSSEVAGTAPVEQIPDMENIVYADELLLSRQERQRNRKFFKQDAYHLPDLNGGIEAMGRPDDPRIMSVEELEEYARQFHNGEDINLYDFSKIDFDGEFFKSLPPADRYNILNAARIRSRLRMGLSKDQLDDMFPDRMAFSRFQIERVKERNHLTQRLMYEMGMGGIDLTINVNARIAGEKNREYILVKNDGVEGGWALGVVSKDKDEGEIHKPIDVDALDFQYQGKDDDDWEDADDFEDVPIEGLNRLPKLNRQPRQAALQQAQDAGSSRRQFYDSRRNDEVDQDDDDALFVNDDRPDDLFGDEAAMDEDEEEDLNRAIALSLQNQHGVGAEVDDAADFEDVPVPTWTQKPAAEETQPIKPTKGRSVANIVNSRANAAVRRRDSNSSSDSDVDLQTALARARKKQAASTKPTEKAPIKPNVKNPFDGPLPFEKLDWKATIFGGAGTKKQQAPTEETGELEPVDSDEELDGGFERDTGKNKDEPRPLPPWMVDHSDIRDSVKRQQELDKEMNAEDDEFARDEALRLQRERQNRTVFIDSSDDDSDIEIVEAPDEPKETTKSMLTEELLEQPLAEPRDVIIIHDSAEVLVDQEQSAGEHEQVSNIEDGLSLVDQGQGDLTTVAQPVLSVVDQPAMSPSPDIEFEDVDLPTLEEPEANSLTMSFTGAETFEDVIQPTSTKDLALADPIEEDIFADAPSPGDFDEFSDAEDEELLEQMAQEAEEHARFASQLNNKSERENQEAYERELRALRTQQKKDKRDADEVTQIMVTECQALLRLFGIPYITAPMEAEAQCAELVHLGLVDGIVTDDSDIFLFGGTRVYKNMFNSNKFVECYLGEDLEKELSLSREALIAIAHLLGSDYTEGIPGVGPVTAVEILSEFPGPTGLVEFKEWWQDVQLHNRPKNADMDSPFRKKFRKSQAAKLFLPPGFPNPAVADAYLKPEVDRSAEQFQWGVPNLDGLRQFLMSTIGWSQERTDEVLVPVIKDMNRRDVEGTQTNITRYFEGGVGVGVKEAFAPRQRGKGSKRMADAVNKLRASTSSSRGLSMELPVMVATAPKTSRKRKQKQPIVVDDDGNDDEDIYDDDKEVHSPSEARPRGEKRTKA
jgi:DNA excision repair protein ERCC-5